MTEFIAKQRFITNIVLERPGLDHLEFNDFALEASKFVEKFGAFSKETILLALLGFLKLKKFLVPDGFAVKIAAESEEILVPDFLQGVLIVLEGFSFSLL